MTAADSRLRAAIADYGKRIGNPRVVSEQDFAAGWKAAAKEALRIVLESERTLTISRDGMQYTGTGDPAAAIRKHFDLEASE